MADPNLSQLAATTLRNRNDVSDSVTNHNAFLAWMKAKGKIKTRTGGRTYVEPITYSDNSTAKFFDGGMESFTIPIESNISASEWNRKHQAGFIYFTEDEKQANRGEAAAVRLVDTKLDVLKATLANDFSTALYNDGTTSNQIVGLQAQVADDPTTGTLGGINAATYSWWRNSYTTGTTASASNIKSLMTAQWLGILRGSDRPDVAIAGANMFEYYHDSLSDLQRFTKSDSADVTNFDGLQWQTINVLYDPTCNTKRLYFLDCSQFEMACDPGKRWQVLDSRTISNALYDVTPVAWSGALIMRRREGHGVINGT